MNPSADAQEELPETESPPALPRDWRLRLHRYTCRYLDSTGAEDVVQESTIRYEREKDIIRHPLAWLHRTARNLALNEIRKNRQTVPFDETIREKTEDQGSQPYENLERLEKLEHLDTLLADLDDRERELLRLKFEEGASYKEMGDRMNLSTSNVGFLLCRTIKRLQSQVQTAGGQR